MKMSFHVGQKVVCVNNTPVPHLLNPDLKMSNLRKGHIYTVREIGLIAWQDGAPAIRLEELRRDDPDDTPFWAHRFRPLTERKTDISIFKEILVGSQKEYLQ